ncbi:acyl-CoA dehydrogenase family protein [Yinghuangia aomiensis]|uniref:Acyl-CoA dehydrogenase family protein n=1 Tax=Yinghuangia aomiensis TaxID=676205 RepID=A0ABP9I7D1_9ACTN
MTDNARELRELVADVVDGMSFDDRGSDHLWATLCDLGLPRVGIDEARGGSGGTFADLAVVVRALAEQAVGLPVGENALASWVLAHDRAVDGTGTTLAFAIDGEYREDMAVLRIPAVPWLRQAGGVVVYRGGDDASYVETGEGVRVDEAENLAGEPRDTLSVLGAAGTPLRAAPPMPDVRGRHTVLRAAAVAGAAEGAYRLTRDYVMQREQFGKPLARIPAVAAGLAGMKVAIVQLDAVLARAVDLYGTGTGTALRPRIAAAAAAAVIAADAAAVCARTAHQLHGAMGVTREYPLHHYTKRLWAWPGEVGSETHSAEYLGARALAGGEAAVWDELTA